MPSATPKVSVVIPSYNREAFLGDCIESVLGQSARPHEILVIDDGSEDGSQGVARRYEGESGFQYIRKPHTGAPDTRNWGLRMASGDYVMTVASDDVAFEETLERLLESHAETPGLDLYYGDLVATSDNLEPLRRIRYPQYHPKSDRLKSSLAFTNQIGDPFTLLRRDWAIEVGGYSEDFQRCQDWDLWTRRDEGLRLKHIGAELGYWRWHDQNLSANRSDRGRLDYDRMLRTRVRSRGSGAFHLENLGWAPLADSNRGRPLLIWGAGEYGETVLDLLSYAGLSVAGFLDSDERKWGTRIGEFEVLDRSGFESDAKPLIAIASVYEHEIAGDLEAQGYVEGVDFFRPRGVEYHRL